MWSRKWRHSLRSLRRKASGASEESQPGATTVMAGGRRGLFAPRRGWERPSTMKPIYARDGASAQLWSRLPISGLTREGTGSTGEETTKVLEKIAIVELGMLTAARVHAFQSIIKINNQQSIPRLPSQHGFPRRRSLVQSRNPSRMGCVEHSLRVFCDFFRD
jgi:hypothetical protein